MQMTAVVINAGIGDLSLGFEKAGFKIIAAYEAEQKAAEVHCVNLNTPVYPLPFKEDGLRSVPSADLLAARLYRSVPSHAKFIAPEEHRATARDFLMLLDFSRPRAFFLAFSVSFLKSEAVQILLNDAAGKGYRCVYQILDVAQVTGAPVAERMAFMVGTRPDIRADFKLPENKIPTPLPPEEFLQLKGPVDSWYFNAMNNAANIPAHQDGSRFYCWKSGAYVGTDIVRWNYWKIPLIDTGGQFRKITHREVANLKGFPSNYVLPDHSNKSWLYQKLIYSANIQAIKQIADGIVCGLTVGIQEQQIPRELQFANLFTRWLSKLTGRTDIKAPSLGREPFCDFTLQMECQTLHFELKSYSGRFVPSARIKNTCERLLSLSKKGTPILVLANEVSKYSKANALEQYHALIWDVRNLLWLFSGFENIKDEFIALLDYAIRDIEPAPPDGNMLPEVLKIPQGTKSEQVPQAESEVISEDEGEVKKESKEWENRLQDIPPGKEHFQAYEQFCFDILKYTLGEYLTLWERQKRTENGLNRFDLCCKIKSGIHQDFFDTIMRYFNTKYIVFEFKNYSDKISQKEIYSTEKYLYGTALRKAAIVISRQGSDDHALRAAKGSLRENGKLILCLSDQDLLKMAAVKTQGEKEPADFLGEMLDRLLIHLEK